MIQVPRLIDMVSRDLADATGATFREIDLAALIAARPQLADAPVAKLMLAEMLLRGADPEAELAKLVAGNGDLAFRPARVLMQDYAGSPALLDIAALRGDLHDAGGDPACIGLSRPVDLVIDHSVMVMQTGQGAETANLAHEYAQNAERFSFLKWAEQAFDGLRVVPPSMGIVHQMNLEHFSEPVRVQDGWLLPDSLVGTDSHSTMCGGLGILGWGVGGIEATAVLLDLPVAVSVPQILGLRLDGRLGAGVQATDLALALTRFLRELQVVGQIVEFHGPGVAALSVADRASVANMAPEYGATAGFFPCDAAVVTYLEEQGRIDVAARLREYLARQPVLSDDRPRRFDREAVFDLSSVGITIAGPKLPHQTSRPADVARSYNVQSAEAMGRSSGDIVLAAITSCTITSNPRAMITAGLVAKAARAKGLQLAAHIKASFSPGSRKVTDYLRHLGLLPELEALGFGVAGYGCMTCVGNSGELSPQIEAAARDGVSLCAVLSGNRNFEARIHPAIAQNYLMSPALVIAQSLLGHMRDDVTTADLGQGVRLADIWPSEAEVQALLSRINGDMPPDAARAEALAKWDSLLAPQGPLFDWPQGSTFFTKPTAGFGPPQTPVLDKAQPLLVLGDAITTDHISPVSRIAPDSPAGRALAAEGVAPADFGAYGARRGNPQIMRKGTFANPRLQNALAGKAGWFTKHIPSDEILTIDQAADRYQAEGRAVVVYAGENYGIGSARDWAAKGTAALGVRAVIAKSFERIHRTNLALVGVLPLQVTDWPEQPQDYDVTLDLSPAQIGVGTEVALIMTQRYTQESIKLAAKCRLDTNFEVECWRAGGMLALAAAGNHDSL